MRTRVVATLLATTLGLVVAGPTTAYADPPLTDSIICPILAIVFPPQGDIPGAWDCPPYDTPPWNAPSAHLTIHKFPATLDQLPAARLYAHPGPLYECRDVHTGLVVAQGSALATPNPGVSCVPTDPDSTRCFNVGAGGYHADQGLGGVTVTSACSGLSVSHAMTIPFGSGSRSSANGSGGTPWTCTVQESATAQLPITDYWVYCDINLA